MVMFDRVFFLVQELVVLVGELRDKVKRERLEKAELEKNIRQEISAEVNEIMVETEQNHR